ncbi:TPA: carbamate kinase [Candidatus Geothermarchaeota archaeon]|nr:carbamate kinase [Candidatus Geothermarchaeota archaeon]
MKILVALGGNALSQPNQDPTYEMQYRNAYKAMEKILNGISSDDQLIITHGNGMQVGVTLLRYLAAKDIKPYPLYAAVGETQGFIGHILASAIYDVSRGEHIAVPIVTHVVVDKDDPAFENPSKPIGPIYTFDEMVEMLDRYSDWKFIKTANGWRRVVPSPEPIDIVEKSVIKELFEAGVTTIACGGGGIPVVKEGGGFKGVDAVIDKDKASSLLARMVKVDRLVILTGVEYVYLNYGEQDMTPIKEIDVNDMRNLLGEYEFEEGSIKPKIEAAIEYVEYVGGEAVITSLDKAGDAIKGRVGTIITR